VRAAIKYLRRKKGDADKIAPSLYESHGIRKKKRGKDKSDKVESPQATEVASQPSIAASAVSNVPANDATRDFVAARGPFVEQA